MIIYNKWLMMMETSQRGRHVCSICGLHFALKASLKAHVTKHAHKPPASNDNDSDTGSGIIEYLDTPQPSSSSSEQKHYVSQHLDEKVRETLPTHSSVGGPMFSLNVIEMDNQSVSLPCSTSGNFFRCASCLKVFDSRGKLMQHQTSKSHQGVVELNMKPDDVKKANSTPSLSQTNDGVENVLPNIDNLLPYRCALCVRYFDSEDKLQQHEASVGHLNKLKSKSDSGHSHIVSESIATASASIATFPCLYSACGKLFDNPSKLLQHQIMKKHRDSDMGKAHLEPSKPFTLQLHEDELFHCDVDDCDRAFPNEDRLLQHKKDKHKVVELDSSELVSLPDTTDFQPFLEPTVMDKAGMESDDGYTSLGPAVNRRYLEGNYHVEKFPKLTPVGGGSLAAVQQTVPPAPTKPVRVLCDKCVSFNEEAEKKSFIFLTYVAKHILKDHPPPDYVRGFCPICKSKIDKMKNILTHIARNHLLNKFPEEACFICLRLCKDKNDLQQHTTAVHRFKCMIDECNSMFPSKALRDKHMLQKHGVHACSHEDCQAIFTSIEDKQRHMRIPHPVDSDSDSGNVNPMLFQALAHRSTTDVNHFSEPPGAVAANHPHEDHPYSADEKLSAIPRHFDTSQNAAHRLFRNSLKHMQTTLFELREPLRRPVNPLCVDETITLCDDLIAELTDIRNRYQMSYRQAQRFDIDLLHKS